MMTPCEHKTSKVIQSGNGWKMWQCEWGCQRLTIETSDGQEQTLTELVAERDRLRLYTKSLNQMGDMSDKRIFELRKKRDELHAALSAIVTAKRNHDDLSGALIQAAWLVDGFEEATA